VKSGKRGGKRNGIFEKWGGQVSISSANLILSQTAEKQAMFEEDGFQEEGRKGVIVVKRNNRCRQTFYQIRFAPGPSGREKGKRGGTGHCSRTKKKRLSRFAKTL